jgi:hypothetical protein
LGGTAFQLLPSNDFPIEQVCALLSIALESFPPMVAHAENIQASLKLRDNASPNFESTGAIVLTCVHRSDA